MRDRHELFERVISRWPGSFEDEEEAVESYMSSYPALVSLDPRTREAPRRSQVARHAGGHCDKRRI